VSAPGLDVSATSVIVIEKSSVRLLVWDPTPAGGDDLEDLIGGAQTR